MKSVMRGAVALLSMGSLLAGAPAGAQFFFKSHDVAGQPVIGDEPGIGAPLPGATPDELRASVVWNMRSALNVAALQCQFEPTLLTVSNYNAILTDHKDELKGAYDTLAKYFTRVSKSKAAGQAAFDQFGTRTYSGFATVTAQYGFCQTASTIGREAIFAPRGGFTTLAITHMRELRNSLTPYGEEGLNRFIGWDTTQLPSFDKRCWSRGTWSGKCGAWPPAGASVAAR